MRRGPMGVLVQAAVLAVVFPVMGVATAPGSTPQTPDAPQQPDNDDDCNDPSAAVEAPAEETPRAPALIPDPTTDTWLKVETGRVIILTNGGAGMAERLARDLADLHQAIFEMNPDLQLLFDAPTYVLAFKNDRSWAPYARFTNEGTLWDGAFFGWPERHYLVLSMGRFGNRRMILYHEYVHHLLASLFPRIPPWLHEGLAGYFATMSIHPGKVQIGVPPPYCARFLRNIQYMPLELLLEVDHASREFKEDLRIGRFYCQSWALVHYLMQDDPGNLMPWARYVERLEAGDRHTAAMESAFGRTRESIEYGAIGYMHAGEYPKHGIRRIGAAPLEGFDVVEAPPADILTHIGWYELAGGEDWWPRARHHFKGALEHDPTRTLASIGAAMTHLQQEGFEEAERLMAAALHHAPDHELLLALYTVAVISRLESPTAPGGPEKLAEVRERLRDALERKPESVEARLWLGATYVDHEGDLTEGIEALEAARAMAPERCDAPYFLAQLFAGPEQADRAAALFEEARKGQCLYTTIDEVEDDLVQLRLRQAWELSGDGHVDEARDMLRRLRNTMTDSERVSKINRALDQFDKQRE